jgi:hypothetical protein
MNAVVEFVESRCAQPEHSVGAIHTQTLDFLGLEINKNISSD